MEAEAVPVEGQVLPGIYSFEVPQLRGPGVSSGVSYRTLAHPWVLPHCATDQHLTPATVSVNFPSRWSRMHTRHRGTPPGALLVSLHLPLTDILESSERAALLSLSISDKKTEAQRDSVIWLKVTYLITYLHQQSDPSVLALDPSSLPSQNLSRTHVSFGNFGGLVFYLRVPPFLDILSGLQRILSRPLSRGTVNSPGTSWNRSPSPADDIRPTTELPFQETDTETQSLPRRSHLRKAGGPEGGWKAHR